MNFIAMNPFTVTPNKLEARQKGCVWALRSNSHSWPGKAPHLLTYKSRKLLFFCLTIGPSDKQNRSPPKLLEVQEV